MAGTKVSSRKLRKSVKSRRVKQRGGLPNFLSMFEGRKAGDEGHGPGEPVPREPVTSPGKEEEHFISGPTHDEPHGDSTGSMTPTPVESGGVRKLFGFGGRRSRRRASRRGRRTARRTGRRVRRSRRRSNRRK
jgi:hypothetical protein